MNVRGGEGVNGYELVRVTKIDRDFMEKLPVAVSQLAEPLREKKKPADRNRLRPAGEQDGVQVLPQGGGRGMKMERSKMDILTEKENDILGRMEDVISEKVDRCKENVQSMTDKDWYNFQLMVIMMGRIQSIKSGKIVGDYVG